MNKLMTYTQKDGNTEEENSNQSSLSYINLPFGVYTKWCVTWFDNDFLIKKVRLVEREISLTRYSCSWQDYLAAKCNLEAVLLNINREDNGEDVDCSASQ